MFNFHTYLVTYCNFDVTHPTFLSLKQDCSHHTDSNSSSNCFDSCASPPGTCEEVDADLVGCAQFCATSPGGMREVTDLLSGLGGTYAALVDDCDAFNMTGA